MRLACAVIRASAHAVLEQFWAEHHIPVFASFAALDVNHHALAIDVADFQVCQFSASYSGWRRGSSTECDEKELELR